MSNGAVCIRGSCISHAVEVSFLHWLVPMHCFGSYLNRFDWPYCKLSQGQHHIREQSGNSQDKSLGWVHDLIAFQVSGFSIFLNFFVVDLHFIGSFSTLWLLVKIVLIVFGSLIFNFHLTQYFSSSELDSHIWSSMINITKLGHQHRELKYYVYHLGPWCKSGTKCSWNLIPVGGLPLRLLLKI